MLRVMMMNFFCYLSEVATIQDDEYGARIAHKGKELSPANKIFPLFRRSLIIMLHYCTEKQIKRIIN